MRVFGLVGLLLALVIVGLLAKKQFATIAAPVLPAPKAVTDAQAPAADTGPANAGERSQQVQQKYKQAIDAAMQTPRKMPDDN